MGNTATQTERSARSLDDLRRSIDPAYATSQRFAEIQRELAGMVSAGAAEQAQANAVLEIAQSRYLGVATAAERAEQAQREQAAAVANATSNYQALRASLDPVYASSKRYEAAQEALSAAVREGVISQTEMNRVLAMAERQYLAPVAPLKGMTVAAQAAATGSTRMGGAMVNAGFQVQDFAVQVASGQSAMVAFAQQFPQLMGVLGFTGKLAIAGAAIGTLAAVGFAVAPMLFDMGKEARTTQEAIEDLTGSLDSYRDAITNTLMPMDELWAKFGQGTQAARETYAALVEIERIQYFRDMQATVGSLTGDFQKLSTAVQDWQAATKLPDFMREEAIAEAGRAAQQLTMNFGLSVVEAHRVAAAIQSFKAASDAGPREAAAASRALGDELMRAYEASGRTNVSLLNSAEQAYQFSISAQEAAYQLGNADTAASGAAASTNNWAMAMAGVRAEILGIVSALSQIGGGMISNAAKYVEINALKAGRSVAEARVEMEKFNVAAKYDGQIMAAESKGGILGWTEAQALKAAKSLEMAGIAATTEADALRKNAAEAERAATSKGRSGGASKKAASESDKLAKSLDREAQQWRDLLDPMSRYKRDMADLAKLTGILSKDEMAKAMRNLNVEMVDGLPLAGDLVDTLVDGLGSGFKGTLSDLGGLFKRWILEQIAFAGKNRIAIAMTANASGIGGMAGAAAGVPGMGGVTGAGGMIGSVMGGASAFAGSFMAGASGFASAAMGGLGSAATYTSFMLNGATAGLSGFGAALGAIALPIAAVVAVFSFFKKKTKELDRGIRVTVDGMDTLVETFRKTETKRFWGLSKKVRTSYDDADRETQDALSRVVGTLQAGVMDAAGILGFGAETFAAFSHVMKVSTKGMSEQDAMKAVQEAVAGLGDDFAGMVPGLTRLAKDGEGASDALSRLAQSLVGVNGIMDTLGHRFRAAGLIGADVASQMAEAFGGLDAMAQATQAFYQAFYGEAERLATTTRQTTQAVASLGLAMPKTRAEYRAIIAALDLTTEKGRATYAALIGMSGAMDQILPQIAGFTAQMEALQGRVSTALETVMDGLSDAIKANTAAAADWRKAGEGIREYLDKLRGTASALVSPQQALANNRALLNRTLGLANRGDAEAAGNLPGAAQAYLGSVMDTAKTRAEAAIAQARVAASLGNVATKAVTTASALENIAGLQQRQVDILAKAQESIAAGNALTRDGITRLLGQLGGLDARIALRAEDAGTIVAGFGAALKTVSIPGADGLRTALVDLRAAIVAETARQQAAVKAATGVVNKPAPKPATPATPAKPAAAAKTYGLADYKLVGGYTVGGSESNGHRYTIKGPLGGTRSFTDMSGGTSWQDWIKGKGFPAFATGGTHTGGARIVGERGPELEVTGPSRIYSNSQTRQMFDQSDLVAEVKALRQELSRMRDEQRQIGHGIHDQARKATNRLMKWDADGLPKERA